MGAMGGRRNDAGGAAFIDGVALADQSKPI